MIYLLFVWNNFTRKRNLVKSRDRMSDCDKGQTSTAYRRMGIHLLSTRWKTTSSEAARPTFPKTVFTELRKERFAWSRLSWTNEINSQIFHCINTRLILVMSRFSVWRQLRAGAVKQTPARLGVVSQSVWPRFSIESCFSVWLISSAFSFI